MNLPYTCLAYREYMFVSVYVCLSVSVHATPVRGKHGNS